MMMIQVINAGARDAVLSLLDDVSSWQPGDKIVIASTDYDMNHAEEFTLAHCRSCASNQIKLNGQYTVYINIRFLPRNATLR